MKIACRIGVHSWSGGLLAVTSWEYRFCDREDCNKWQRQWAGGEWLETTQEEYGQDVADRSAAKKRGALAAPGAGAATGGSTSTFDLTNPNQGASTAGPSLLTPVQYMALVTAPWPSPFNPPPPAPAPAPEPTEPERTTLGYVRGWRSFKVDDKGVLMALTRVEVWLPYEPLEARCQLRVIRHPSGETDPPHDAPHWPCSCGLYAFNNRAALGRDHDEVSCEVALWGRVIVHETGYRAQFAYPQKVLCDSATGHALAAEVGARYGIATECSHE